MKDNLSENNEEKDIKSQENKSLEQRILDDIDAYEAADNGKSAENEETEVKDLSKPEEVTEPGEKSIEESEKQAEQPVENEQKETVKATAVSESNYQINLINENLLRIKVKTRKGVNIDCSVKDTKSLTETQSNRLYLHPKPSDDIQEVEIIISIDPSTGNLTFEKKKDEASRLISPVFTPNPEVENLIMPVDLGRPEDSLIPLTEDEVLEEKIGKKNPFHLNRLVYRKNMSIGIISAVVFACVAVFLFYNFYGKTETRTIEPEKRLIVINDIPVKINFKEYEDPNKPKEEPKPEDGSDPNKITPPTITRNVIRAPKINRPKINTANDSTLTNDASRELDSLRKLQVSNDSLKKLDSLKNLASDSANVLPDSMRTQLAANSVGLQLDYPKNWQQVDPKTINPEKDGVLLIDTVNGPGAVNLFVTIDSKSNEYNAQKFKTAFPMNDSTIIAYISDARTDAGTTELNFYLFTKTEKLAVKMQSKKQFFDQYRPIVEAIVRTIRITPPSPK